MRYMRPDPDQGFPTKYICSNCNWRFSLEHVSEVADFLEQRTAMRAFSVHDCASFPCENEQGENLFKSA